MLSNTRSKFACAMVTAALTFGVAASSANAQTQEGLVNVNVSGVVIQVPVSVAANLCDINVNVLSGPQIDLPAECEATAESIATPGTGSGPAPPQEGLVNVNVSDVTVQLPISVAANVCDVNVNVLAAQLDSPAECDAVATSTAEPSG
jgi:hypothetical protein